MSDDGKKGGRADAPGNGAIYAVFAEYKAVLRSMLTRRLNRQSDQEDLLQETFALAFEAEKKHPIRHPKSYLFKVAKSLVIRENSKVANKLTDYIEDFGLSDLSSLEPSAFEQLAGKEEMDALRRAVEQLPPQCRKVFIMRKHHGMTHKEIAKTLGLSVSTTEKHLANALEKCSQYMRAATDRHAPASAAGHKDQKNKHRKKSNV